MQRLLSCRAVLRALGNAATAEHVDSTRHASYLALRVGPSGRVTRAALAAPMLEVERVFARPAGEGNFHWLRLLAQGNAVRHAIPTRASRGTEPSASAPLAELGAAGVAGLAERRARPDGEPVRVHRGLPPRAACWAGAAKVVAAMRTGMGIDADNVERLGALPRDHHDHHATVKVRGGQSALSRATRAARWRTGGCCAACCC